MESGGSGESEDGGEPFLSLAPQIEGKGGAFLQGS